MKGVIILLTLSILGVLVQEISSASPRAIAPSRSTYGGLASNKNGPPSKHGEGYHDKKNSPFFPGNAMMLFQLKTAITSSLHKIEDDEESLARIMEKIKLLKGLLSALFSFYKDAVEGLITKCVIFGGNTFPNPIKIGNKCYTISDTGTGAVPDETYEDARQKCLAHGGDLAAPSLLPGSTFGVDLKKYLEQALQSSEITTSGNASTYWIDGRTSADDVITTSYNFNIPPNFSRYLTVSKPPYEPVDFSGDYGLTFVGPILANMINWYIDIMPFENEDEDPQLLPYICEFNTVFYLEGFSSEWEHKLFRADKSSLLQDFIRKVKLIHTKKLAARKPLVDAANLKAEEVKTEVISQESQEVKVDAMMENKKKSAQPESDHGTKTTEVVEKVENTKAEEMPTATKKDELPETEKIQQKEEIKVTEELSKKENVGTTKGEEVGTTKGEDVGIAKEEDMVVEGDKNVNEKAVLLEDILGKLEQLESFRALKQ